MQLQRDLPLLRKAGLGLAAISYDSSAVLSEFAKRKSIAFPLLSDHESNVIRAYGVADRHFRKGAEIDVQTEQVYLDPTGNVPAYGLSYPSVFVLTRDRHVKWRFVSEGPEFRLTGASILEESIGAITEGVRAPVANGGGHLAVSATATNTALGLGNRIRIGVELKMPAGFHVYSPEVGGDYKGVSWTMDPTSCLDVGEPAYPKAEWKLLKWTTEKLPLYEGTLRISRELVVKPAIRPTDPSIFRLFMERCVDSTGHIKVSGVLKFQACDERECFPPQTVRPEWKFEFIAPDRQRSSDKLKRENEQWTPKED